MVAPIPTGTGEPLVRLRRFGVALYPFVDGQSLDFDDWSPSHRAAALDLVVAVHTAPVAARRRALLDDFTVPHRDAIEAVLRRPSDMDDAGPYARRTADLLRAHADLVQALFDRYDALVAQAGKASSRRVLTHGEPHPGNTMRTADGWRLIDWDTALVAAPERDLWVIDPGDGSVLDAYATTTGVRPQSTMIELYRLRWDLADLASYVSRFRRPHRGSADDDHSWANLTDVIARHR